MQVFNGTVISNKNQKTVIVKVVNKGVHPLYKKVFKKSKNYKVDVNGITVSLGDTVQIVQTRPISKEKHFKISKLGNKKEEVKKKK